MDYKGLAESAFKHAKIFKMEGDLSKAAGLERYGNAITDLLAHAEEAEARAEKAERERDEFKAKYIEAVNRACELSKIVDDHGWEE